jgi:CDP-glucose 4,6-dehydratase
MNKAILEQTYQCKKVFLTGHTGFKGSWMLQWLHLLGATVKGYSLAPENNEDLYHHIYGDSLCDSVIADLCQKDTLEKSILDFRPDFVFHLAAQPLVRQSYEMPVKTIEVNVLGTAHVLDAVRKLENSCTVVLITTDKVYENKEWVFPYRENDRLGGHDPYSASKACAEIIINSYLKSFFHIKDFSQHNKAVASARAGNVIGGGDWAKDRIIPDIIRALLNEEPVKVRNPYSVRPWQHVLESIGGYLLLGAKLKAEPLLFQGAWNFGPYAEDNKVVEELVVEALKIWGEGSYEKTMLISQPHEAELLKLDISKATSLLKWKPVYNSSQAINKTVEWYKIYHKDRSNIKSFTIDQIIDYQESWRY